MKKDPIKPDIFYTGATHPLGAGYFLIYIGYTQITEGYYDHQLIRLDKGWVIYQPCNTLARSTPYRLLPISATAAWQVAVNHGQAIKFKAIESLVAEIRKDTPGINSLLLAVSEPFSTSRQICKPTWDKRSSALQSAAPSPPINNRLSLPWPGKREILDPKR